MPSVVSRVPSAVRRRPYAVLVALALCAAPVLASPAPDSQRMSRAKDYIADEQWNKAIEELRKAADDPKEASRDEALFWLAHSQHAAGDQPGAIETIARLERTYPASRWVRPARSLRVEIAQQLKRDDLLWRFAAPPPPPAPAPTPAPGRVPRAAPVPPTPAAPAVAPAPAPMPPPPPLPPGWLPEAYVPDTDVRIQALGSLIQTEPARAIPMLRDIALATENANEARRAVLVLAQSPTPEAEGTVLELARRASEPVRIAAIREMGRFESPRIPAELLQIAKSEADAQVRSTAIVTLGRAGARDQLRVLYVQAPPEFKGAVLTALFNARDEDELIRIASTEKNAALRAQALRQLEVLGTPKALAFLKAHPPR